MCEDYISFEFQKSRIIKIGFHRTSECIDAGIKGFLNFSLVHRLFVYPLVSVIVQSLFSNQAIVKNFCSGSSVPIMKECSLIKFCSKTVLDFDVALIMFS